MAYHGWLAVTSRSSFMHSCSRGYTLVSRMYCGSEHRIRQGQPRRQRFSGEEGMAGDGGYLVEIVALEEALVADLRVPRLLLAAVAPIRLLRRRRRCR